MSEDAGLFCFVAVALSRPDGAGTPAVIPDSDDAYAVVAPALPARSAGHAGSRLPAAGTADAASAPLRPPTSGPASADVLPATPTAASATAPLSPSSEVRLARCHVVLPIKVSARAISQMFRIVFELVARGVAAQPAALAAATSGTAAPTSAQQVHNDVFDSSADSAEVVPMASTPRLGRRRSLSEPREWPARLEPSAVAWMQKLRARLLAAQTMAEKRDILVAEMNRCCVDAASRVAMEAALVRWDQSVSRALAAADVLSQSTLRADTAAASSDAPPVLEDRRPDQQPATSEIQLPPAARPPPATEALAATRAASFGAAPPSDASATPAAVPNLPSRLDHATESWLVTLLGLFESRSKRTASIANVSESNAVAVSYPGDSPTASRETAAAVAAAAVAEATDPLSSKRSASAFIDSGIAAAAATTATATTATTISYATTIASSSSSAASSSTAVAGATVGDAKLARPSKLMESIRSAFGLLMGGPRRDTASAVDAAATPTPDSAGNALPTARGVPDSGGGAAVPSLSGPLAEVVVREGAKSISARSDERHHAPKGAPMGPAEAPKLGHGVAADAPAADTEEQSMADAVLPQSPLARGAAPPEAPLRIRHAHEMLAVFRANFSHAPGASHTAAPDLQEEHKLDADEQRRLIQFWEPVLDAHARLHSAQQMRKGRRHERAASSVASSRKPSCDDVVSSTPEPAPSSADGSVTSAAVPAPPCHVTVEVAPSGTGVVPTPTAVRHAASDAAASGDATDTAYAPDQRSARVSIDISADPSALRRIGSRENDADIEPYDDTGSDCGWDMRSDLLEQHFQSAVAASRECSADRPRSPPTADEACAAHEAAIPAANSARHAPPTTVRLPTRDELVQLVRQGVPAVYRGRVWKLLARRSCVRDGLQVLQSQPSEPAMALPEHASTATASAGGAPPQSPAHASLRHNRTQSQFLLPTRRDYRRLARAVSPYERQIQQDIGRTFPEYSMFAEHRGPGQMALLRLMRCVCAPPSVRRIGA